VVVVVVGGDKDYYIPIVELVLSGSNSSALRLTC